MVCKKNPAVVGKSQNFYCNAGKGHCRVTVVHEVSFLASREEFLDPAVVAAVG